MLPLQSSMGSAMPSLQSYSSTCHPGLSNNASVNTYTGGITSHLIQSFKSPHWKVITQYQCNTLPQVPFSPLLSNRNPFALKFVTGNIRICQSRCCSLRQVMVLYIAHHMICVFQGLNGGLIGMMETNCGVPQQESQMHITVLNYLVYKQPIQDSLEGLC